MVTSVALYLAVSPLFIPDVFLGGDRLDKAFQLLCLSTVSFLQSAVFALHPLTHHIHGTAPSKCVTPLSRGANKSGEARISSSKK
jgi:hypothetical protein